MMLSADVLGAAGGEKIECPSQHLSQHLRTNTSLPVSTPGSLTPKAVSPVNHRPWPTIVQPRPVFLGRRCDFGVDGFH